MNVDVDEAELETVEDESKSAHKEKATKDKSKSDESIKALHPRNRNVPTVTVEM